MLHIFERMIRRTGARLAIFDNKALAFMGNHFDIVAVTQFLDRIEQIAYRHDCAVLLIGHIPSGDSGKDYYGSVAWQNRVRCRMTLKWADPKERERHSLRKLTLAKENTIRTGIDAAGPREITLRGDVEAGVLRVVVSGENRFERHARERMVEDVFLRCLRKTGQQGRVVRSERLRNHVPKVFLRTAEARQAGVTGGELAEAMERLFDQGKIIEGEVRDRGRHTRTGLMEVQP